jgi:hypothetical protein
MLKSVQVSHEAVKESTEKLLEAKASEYALYASAYLEFWQNGIELLPVIENESSNESIECPFCEQPTITVEFISELQKRLSDSQTLTKARREFNHTIHNYVEILSRFGKFLKEFQHALIKQEDVEKLKLVFERDEEQITLITNRNAESYGAVNKLIEFLHKQMKDIKKLGKVIDNPVEFTSITTRLDVLPQRLTEMFEDVVKKSTVYAEVFSVFLPILRRELSDEEVVANYTNLIKLFENVELVRLAVKGNKFDHEIVQAQRASDHYILQKQKEVLKTQEQEMLKWYRYLSPNTDVKFSGLKPGKNSVALQAQAFGKTMNAAASLSQSQLNCLGLSIYIPSVASSESPFEFIVFDDPVQAMDDDHHESFIERVIPELLTTARFQVVVLTHIRKTADRIHHYHYADEHAYYQFDSLSSEGPEIVEYVVLSDEISQIRQLKDGNEKFRLLAQDRIRVLCEHMIREAVLKYDHRSLGPMSASPLLAEFKKLTPVTPQLYKMLEGTIKWANPSHHSPVGLSAPPADHISTHLGKLKKIIKALNLE